MQIVPDPGEAPMTDKTRDAGLDILKAVSILLVVIWHVRPISPTMVQDSYPAAFVVKYIIQFYYFNLTMLSVPSFVLISLYLFIGKLSEIENYWKKRFLKLFQIYMFWVGIQFILYLLLGGNLPLPLETIFRSGGPDLSCGSFMPPMPSIFYYIYVLILCTLLAFLFVKLPEKIKLILSIVIVAASCLYFFIAPLYGITMDTRSMKNFYVYIPAAYYLYHYKDKFVQYRWLYLIMFLLSTVAEQMLMDMTSAFGRVSVFFGTLFLVSVLMSGWSDASRPIRFLSKYSLGIFALHPYWLIVVLSIYSVLRGKDRFLMPQSLPEGILLLAVILGLTSFSVWLLGKTKLRMYVS